MAIVKTLNGKTPQFGGNCFLADTAAVIGDVVMGSDCSVWFSAVVRGDVNSIRIGNKVNIQDNAVIHCTYRTASTSIGSGVSIAHGAVVHGCTVHDSVLIGMRAVVMDHALIESNVIVAAGAVVLEGARLESGCLYAGTPAKKVKELDAGLIEGRVQRIADAYLMYAGWYRDS